MIVLTCIRCDPDRLSDFFYFCYRAVTSRRSLFFFCYPPSDRRNRPLRINVFREREADSGMSDGDNIGQDWADQQGKLHQNAMMTTIECGSFKLDANNNMSIHTTT